MVIESNGSDGSRWTALNMTQEELKQAQSQDSTLAKARKVAEGG